MFRDAIKGHKHGIRGLPTYSSGQHGHMLAARLALQENLLTSIFPQLNWVINGVRFCLTNSELTQDVSGASG